MSSIHYFARYHQKENFATNNTLLLFSRLYHYDIFKFKQFINSMLQESEEQFDPLEPSILFEQQVKGTESVPDGLIYQKSFEIIIETKLYGQNNIEQIDKHLGNFKNSDRKIFLWINKEKITKGYKSEIMHRLRKHKEQKKSTVELEFSSTTFQEIVKTFRDSLSEYDVQMHDIIDDYERFCEETDLISNAHQRMRTVLCNNTLDQNLKYNMYYAPSSRGYSAHTYLGLYANKRINAIGKVLVAVDVEYDSVKKEFTKLMVAQGRLMDFQKNVLLEIIHQAEENWGYSLATGHRFFFVEQYYEIEFLKETKGGLMGTKMFNLSDYIENIDLMTTEEIAKKLDGKKWGQTL